MNEIMTFAEMKAKCDGEWVLIIDPVTSKDMEIVKGKLACHSKDRKKVYRKAMALQPKHAAVLFLGNPPKNMEFVL
jgi:hypothetical protein